MSEVLQTDYSNENEIELPKKILEEIEKVVKEKRLNKEERKKLELEVKKEYLESRLEPGEVIGIIAAQSISEPATQMSLTADEKIIVKGEKNIIEPVEIGGFVDKLIEKFGCVKENNSEIADLPRDIKLFVYSLDQDEKLKLKKIKSVIRHKSPRKLLEIKTASGRKIIATDHHSFVLRHDNKIVPISGKQLKVGNRIPVMKLLPENCVSEIKLSSILSSENLIKIGDRIYPHIAHSKSLPDRLRLDSSLGWLIGAYLSEGNYTKYFVNISNTNENFNQNFRGFAKQFQFTMNEYDNFSFSKGHDIHINSSLLSNFLKITCGTDSKNKKVPSFAFSAKEEFVSALLQSYFDGDSNIILNRRGIRTFSKSKELIDGLVLLLARFGIFCSKSNDGHCLWIQYKYAKTFLEKIGTSLNEQKILLEKLSERWEKTKITAEHTDMIPGIGNLLYDISKKLKLPTRYIHNFTKRQRIGRETLRKYLDKFDRVAKKLGVDISIETTMLRLALNSDIVWDEIEKISYVDSNSEYVYDISVEGLETFTTFDGIITHNTMRTYHFAGTAGIRITYGLPRLIEIFDAKREPETPMMTIYLKKQFNRANSARKVAESIIEKKILNIIKKISLNLNENSIEIELFDKKRISSVISILKENFKDLSVKTKGGKIVAFGKRETDVKELEKIREGILQTQVSGIKGISNAVVRREGENWLINTIGSNLEKVLTINEVDERKTVTNDIHETTKILGIEAARNTIIGEALKTMHEQGLDVDIRHIMLVSDIMTFRGDVRPIGRYGVAGAKTSILARAAFEETIKHLVRASIRNEIDNFQGIFENVMIGQVIPSGTGMFDLVAKFEESEKGKKEE